MGVISIEKTKKDVSSVYAKVLEFKKKFPGCVAFRLKKHASVVERHLNPGEVVLYAFVGQKNDCFYDFTNSCVVVLTNKRILIGRKRLLYGYFFFSFFPDLFNDLSVYQGLIWGQIIIDTVKEVVTISNIDKRALDEIETNITEYMMNEKKKYEYRDLN